MALHPQAFTQSAFQKNERFKQQAATDKLDSKTERDSVFFLPQLCELPGRSVNILSFISVKPERPPSLVCKSTYRGWSTSTSNTEINTKEKLLLEQTDLQSKLQLNLNVKFTRCHVGYYPVHQKHGCEDDLTSLFLEFVLWLQLKGKKLRVKNLNHAHI